jgi:oligopeptide transport system substrate-binding protein
MFRALNSLVLLSLTFSVAIFQSARAAEIPVGTKLSRKQVLNRGNGAEIPTIDPQKVDDAQGANVIGDLFEPLVKENSEGNIIPAGASSWAVSKDGLTYTFSLQKYAKWSNGDPVTAHDYVFGMQRLVDPKLASDVAFLLSNVKNADLINQGTQPMSSFGVMALDNLTLQITLNKVTPYMLEVLANTNLAPMNKKAMEKYGNKFFKEGNLVSNGPYILKYWKVGDKLTLVKNLNYWDAKKTIIEEVNFYPTQNLNTEEQMFFTGQLDITNEISMDSYDKLKSELGNEVISNPYLTSYWFSFNLKNPPFKDNLKLRQALSMAVDRDIISKQVTRRGEMPSYDIVAKGVKNYNQFVYDWAHYPYKERVEKAKNLYREAGYSAAKPLHINILYNTNENSKKLVLAVASMWKQVLGVNASVENQEWKVFLNSRGNRKFEVAWNRWIADYNDASSFIDLSRSDNSHNNSYYMNSKYDVLSKKAATELDLDKRKKIFEQASSLLMNDYTVVPLYSAVSTHLVKNYVGGFSRKNSLAPIRTFDLYIADHK